MINVFTLFRIPLALQFGILVLSSSFTSFAQFEDNPYRDQIPFYLRNLQNQNNSDVPLSTVITLNNWDNFNLAVDFAENNMAENPLQPTWYFTAYNTNAAHHTEDGINWANSVPSFGATMQGDPVVIYDSIGNLFYENMYGTSSIQGCKVIVSSNNGATWGAGVTAISGVDKNWITCDQTSGPYANYVYTTMTASSGGNFARSTDHGLTFQSTFTPSTQTLPGMMVCVGPNGNVQGGSVYVVTNSGSVFNSTYTFYRSTDGGTTFTLMSSQQFANTVGSQVNSRHSVQNMRTRPYPMITADNSYGTYRGRFYCVYASNDPPGNGNKPDIWCRYSTNGGTTWSSAILVNDDPNPQTHHQWHPAIWCDKVTGRLFAMWMDTRDCPTSDSALIYASYSDNGGVTWAANQAISNQKMKINCSTCGGGGTPRYQGDYNGIISNKKVAMAGWTDFRQGTFISMTGYFPDFAMAINHTSDTLYAPNDSTDFIVSIPAVKLYSDTVVLSGQISPPPSSGSITFTFPQGNSITTFPGSKLVRLKLSGSVPASNYQAQFFAKGLNGTPVHQRNATITVLVSQVLAVSVTATPPSICSGNSTQLLATVSGGIAPYTYSWTSNPPGFTSTLPNPAASPTANTWYICTVHDNINTIVKDSVFVTVNSIPATPGTISGNTVPCESDTVIYSINTVPGATTYTWTVPPGTIILSGQNTIAISALIGSNSGNVTVTAGNSCGNSTPSQLAITPFALPLPPGTISGPSVVCAGTTVVFSVPPVSGVINNWTVPPDATIISGQGTPTITVLWGVTSGNVTVDAQNSCGISSPNTLSVAVETIPSAAQTISGPDTVCQGQGGYEYSIPIIPNATTYIWTLPPGASISQGQGTNVVQIDFSGTALSGDVTAAGINMCGTGPESTKYVNVLTCTGTYYNLLQSQIVIYPNPTDGLLILYISGKEKQLHVNIFDLCGHSLFNELYENLPAVCTRQIDVSSFAKGIYMIRLTNGSRIFTEKFVVN
jgi:hypothetical protein